MSNLATRILRQLNACRHAMLECEIQRFYAAYRISDIDRAVKQLRTAKLITWTSCGWLITDVGVIMATGGRRMTFERPRAHPHCINGGPG